MPESRPTSSADLRGERRLRVAEPEVEPGEGIEAPVQASEEEHALCQKIAQGDDAAFEALVLRYQHRVYAFCVRLLADRAEAEDVAQDVFLTIYRCAGEFRGESSFTTWLFRIAKNQSLNRIKYLERRGRSRKTSIDELNEEGLGRIGDISERRPDVQYESGQTAAIVQEAIATLHEDHRAVLVLRDIEDLSYEEISDITHLPIGTVKSRIHRGRTALATRLARIFR